MLSRLRGQPTRPESGPSRSWRGPQPIPNPAVGQGPSHGQACRDGADAATAANCQRHLVAQGQGGWGHTDHPRGHTPGCTDCHNQDAGITATQMHGPRAWGHTDGGPREARTTPVGMERSLPWGCTGYRNRDTRTSITGIYGPGSQGHMGKAHRGTGTTNMGMEGPPSWG